MRLRLSNLRELDDSELVKRAQDDDRKAFRSWYDVTSWLYTGLVTVSLAIKRTPGTLAKRLLFELTGS